MKIHAAVRSLPVARELIAIRHPLRSRELLDLTTRLSAERDLWHGLVPWDEVAGLEPGRRWFDAVFQADAVDVWLIVWPPTSGTPVHDHDSAAGSLSMVAGSLVEYTYERGAGRESVRSILSAGSSADFRPDHVHRVVNESPFDAVSVHAYSPGGRAMRHYDLLEGELALGGAR